MVVSLSNTHDETKFGHGIWIVPFTTTGLTAEMTSWYVHSRVVQAHDKSCSRSSLVTMTLPRAIRQFRRGDIFQDHLYPLGLSQFHARFERVSRVVLTRSVVRLWHQSPCGAPARTVISTEGSPKLQLWLRVLLCVGSDLTVLTQPCRR